jgi:hypothetical protein
LLNNPLGDIQHPWELSSLNGVEFLAEFGFIRLLSGFKPLTPSLQRPVIGEPSRTRATREELGLFCRGIELDDVRPDHFLSISRWMKDLMTSDAETPLRAASARSHFSISGGNTI